MEQTHEHLDGCFSNQRCFILQPSCDPHNLGWTQESTHDSAHFDTQNGRHGGPTRPTLLIGTVFPQHEGHIPQQPSLRGRRGINLCGTSLSITKQSPHLSWNATSWTNVLKVCRADQEGSAVDALCSDLGARNQREANKQREIYTRNNRTTCINDTKRVKPTF